MFGADDLYQEIIMDHNRSPRNYGSMDNPTVELEGFNPLCGDQIKVFVLLDEDKIVDIVFDGIGCAISKSSASIMTVELKGKTISDAQSIFDAFRLMITGKDLDDDSLDLLGDVEVLGGITKYPARIKCASLAWHTVNSALTGDSDVVTTE
ncbi:MAG: SUF system NifU family Fe-S cluster assembly protein [SAR202 cluster bacterium]|nr:SUF system NifU family Fe-S cluster assembly protein [Chloroflexota bacterium]MBI15283.1 SUF system NifU family Fe-S cluster assembly protein [Chloroflexota bacterium]MQG23136.1 SUF system NifU family Fe-S cluster assembly protein [SAR202 cluster bacterium]|tara:strand:- start:15416 stop:15868 length:453 start_codon:yes stop_codon:yes gene_type:complete